MKNRYMFLAAAILLAAATLPGAPTKAGAAGEIDMAAIRAATSRFHQVEVAMEAGYETFLDCFYRPGVGGMGYHYVNFDLLDLELDPTTREAMVYPPGPDGQLQLGAVEYLVPIALWDQQYSGPPVLFGQTFDRNESLGVYALHAWVWKNNPSGMFAGYNPTVSCSR